MDRQENSSRGMPTPADVTSKTRWKIEIKAEVWAAIILGVATIIANLVGSPRYQAVPPVASDTPSAPSITPFFSDTPIVVTETPALVISPSATILPSLTTTMTATAVPTDTLTTLPRPILIVRLTASRNSGRKPLKVKFDARDSYLIDYDAQRYVCRDGACDYTWKVYFYGEPMGKSVNDSGGTFDHTFTKKGTYTVTVWICRGRDGFDCNGSGVQITVV